MNVIFEMVIIKQDVCNILLLMTAIIIDDNVGVTMIMNLVKVIHNFEEEEQFYFIHSMHPSVYWNLSPYLNMQ